jgi:hypothetical protein
MLGDKPRKRRECNDVKWMLGIFAVVGVLVIGLAVAVAAGLVNVADPFQSLSSARPSTQPIADETEANQPTESEASIAALKHPG